MASTKKDKHLNVRSVTRSLIATFGHQTLGNKRNPFDELIFIILSSKTPPERYQLTYSALKDKYPSVDQLARARPSAIARVIEAGGLAEKKARQISAIARALVWVFGRVTLTPLTRMNDQQAEEFLDTLPGVGKKTARCVLMYSLGRPVFPVDAHCFRISQRLGWTSKNSNLTDRVADELQAGIPPELRRDLHVGMVLLGREYCQPRNMHCLECPLLKFCPTGQEKHSIHGRRQLSLQREPLLSAKDR